jgi:hypothetical protein
MDAERLPFERKWAPQPGSEVVLADLTEAGCAVAIPREQAERLAAIHAAVGESTTWEELRSRLPAKAWDELLEQWQQGKEDDEEEHESVPSTEREPSGLFEADTLASPR